MKPFFNFFLFFFFIHFVFSFYIFPQSFTNDDSLLIKIYQRRINFINYENEPQKCGLPDLIYLQEREARLNQLLPNNNFRNRLKKISTKQTSIISPGNFFRIHFDTTGTNIPKYLPDQSPLQNALIVAQIFDYVYDKEIKEFKFLSPPTIYSEFNDNRYDIYIEDLGNSYYGYTEIRNSVGGNKYSTYIVIDNDYPTGVFYSASLDGLKVTAAHEFHHAIQIGSYMFPRSKDIYFAELTSTSMEEFVFPEVNDYINYMKSFFNSPDKTLSEYTGYNLAIWNIYLEKKYSISIIKQQWELLPNVPSALKAIEQSLFLNGTSFAREYANFSILLYFTKNKARFQNIFDDAEYFPKLYFQLKFSSLPTENLINVKPFASTKILYKTNLPLTNDTLAFFISSGNDTISTVSLNVYNYLETGAIQLFKSNNYALSFSFSGFSNPKFGIGAILNDIIILNLDSVINLPSRIDYAFPNPILYNKLNGSMIYFPCDDYQSEHADIFLYDLFSKLLLKQKSKIRIINNKAFVEWNGFTSSQEKLPTGVYIYSVKTSKSLNSGKIAIIND